MHKGNYLSQCKPSKSKWLVFELIAYRWSFFYGYVTGGKVQPGVAGDEARRNDPLSLRVEGVFCV